MKKTLFVIVLTFACVFFAIITRAGVARFFPGLYGRMYPAPAATAAPAPTQKAVAQAEPEPKPEAAPTEELYATGAIISSTRAIVQMSDGSVRTIEDTVPSRLGNTPFAGKSVLQYVTRSSAIVEGKRYFYRPHKTPTAMVPGQGAFQAGAGVTPDRPEAVARTRNNQANTANSVHGLGAGPLPSGQQPAPSSKARVF